MKAKRKYTRRHPRKSTTKQEAYLAMPYVTEAQRKSDMDAERATQAAFMAMPRAETVPTNPPSIEHEDFYAIRRRQVLREVMIDCRTAATNAMSASGLLTAVRMTLSDKSCEANTMRSRLIDLLEACDEVLALDTSITVAHGRLKRAMEDALEIVT